jgi:roadblock/LC7 domain-containing protein
MSPGIVTADLGPRIENLQGSLDLLTTSLEEQRKEIARMSGKPPEVDSTNTERLQLLAKRILSTATTVYGSSIAGGSVHGDPITNEAQLRTTNWITEPVVNERAWSSSSVTQSRGDQTLVSEPDGTVDTDVTKGTTSYSEPEPAEPDSDGEFEFDVTQRLLEEGRKLFDLANYAEAVGFLQKGVASSNRLPNTLRTQVDLIEVPMMIATCKFHLKELDQAESDLLILVQQESISDQDALRKCQISHLLSQIYLIKNELEPSENHCRKSMKGRRRLLGKEHKDYLTSLGLLSEICSMRGKDEEALVYQGMIPPEIARLQKKIRSEENHEKDIILIVKKILQGHTGSVCAIAFSPDGKLVAIGSGDKTYPSGSGDNTAWLRDVATGATRVTLQGHMRPVFAIAFSPDGKLVVTGSGDSTARLWDAETGVTRATLQGHSDSVLAIAFSPSGKLVATGSRDDTARLWGVARGPLRSRSKVQATLRGHRSSVCAIAFSPDGKLVATGSWDTTVRLWDVATGTTQATLQCPESVYAVAFSPDGKLVATGSKLTARLWDVATGTTQAMLHGHTHAVAAVTFSPDGKLVATGSYDNTARLWDVATGTTQATLQGHTDNVEVITFSPDGKLVATGSRDKTARLWGHSDEGM